MGWSFRLGGVCKGVPGTKRDLGRTALAEPKRKGGGESIRAGKKDASVLKSLNESCKGWGDPGRGYEQMGVEKLSRHGEKRTKGGG